jgi:hypothetical protein
MVAVDHPILLRGALLPEFGARPVILERTDQDLMGRLLDDLSSPENPALLRSFLPKTRAEDGFLRLRIPIHRVFHFAAVEIACDTPGRPRLDPAKIDSAGVVIRRVSSTGGFESWLKSERRLQGWLRVPGDGTLDPDPKRRPALRAGHPEIDRRLAALSLASTQFEEDSSPLFPVPPEIAAASGRTILIGLLPLASGDQSETSTTFPPYSTDDLTALLPPHFKSGPAGSIPLPGSTLTPAITESTTFASSLAPFLTFLRQATVEFALFADTPQSRALFAEINTIVLDDGRRAADFLRNASETLLERVPNSSVLMPPRWPTISTAQAARIRNLAAAVLDAQLRRLTGREGRYDDLRRVYRARVFVRVKRPDGCPPVIHWTDYSDPFTIAAWFDPGDQPPAVIPMPDITDRAQLKALTPNVAFSMPESLFNLIEGADLKGLTDGNKPSGGLGIGLGWICSFSLPIITLCAFICLNIFLKLFDIVPVPEEEIKCPPPFLLSPSAGRCSPCPILRAASATPPSKFAFAKASRSSSPPAPASASCAPISAPGSTPSSTSPTPSARAAASVTPSLKPSPASRTASTSSASKSSKSPISPPRCASKFTTAFAAPEPRAN